MLIKFGEILEKIGEIWRNFFFLRMYLLLFKNHTMFKKFIKIHIKPKIIFLLKKVLKIGMIQ